MNKHLKCVLKLLGAPVVFLGMVCCVPLVFILFLVDISGCVDTSEFAGTILDLPEWYKKL